MIITGCKSIFDKHGLGLATDRHMMPGMAIKEVDPFTGEKIFVEVDAEFCRKTCYNYVLRWAGGHSVAEFLGPDGLHYLQPINGDTAMQEKGRRGKRKVRSPRREAPGVAPEVQVTDQKAPVRGAPRRRRSQSFELL